MLLHLKLMYSEGGPENLQRSQPPLGCRSPPVRALANDGGHPFLIEFLAR
jgi:hypothetical protein